MLWDATPCFETMSSSLTYMACLPLNVGRWLSATLAALGRAQGHTHTHTHTHAHAHTHTHTNTHTHTRTHTHTHGAETDIERNKRGDAGLKKVGLKTTFKGRGRKAATESERDRIQDSCGRKAITGQNTV